MAELAADRSLRVVVVTGEGTAFCSGGNTSWIASEPDATVDRPAHPDARRSTGPGCRSGASRCRRSRRSTARRSAPGCASRWPATSGTPPPAPGSACRSCRLGMHAGHGRRPTCCPTSSARRTPATCCSPAASSTPTRRCGSGWSRGSSTGEAFLDDVLEIAAGIAATAPIASRLTKLRAARRRPRRPRDRRCSGRRWPSRSRWPPPTCRRAIRASPREAAAGVHRPLSHAPAWGMCGRGKTRPQVAGRRLPSPCGRRPTRPGASSARNARGARPTGSTGRRVGPPLWTDLWTTLCRTCGQRWSGGVGAVETACGARRTAWRRAGRADQRQCCAPGVDGKYLAGTEPAMTAAGDAATAGRTTAGRSRRCGGSRSCSSAAARTPTRSRRSAARPRRSCRWPTTRSRRAGRGRHAHRARPASAPSTAKVIAAAVARRAAGPAGRARARARRTAHRGRARAAARAARRPALPLRLVRRRLADRGDGVHRDRARPRLPGADRPLAPAARSPTG